MGSRFNILEPHEAEVGPRRRVPPMHPPWANLGQCCGVSAAGQFLLAVKASRAGRSVAAGARPSRARPAWRLHPRSQPGVSEPARVATG